MRICLVNLYRLDNTDLAAGHSPCDSRFHALGATHDCRGQGLGKNFPLAFGRR